MSRKQPTPVPNIPKPPPPPPPPRRGSPPSKIAELTALVDALERYRAQLKAEALYVSVETPDPAQWTTLAAIDDLMTAIALHLYGQFMPDDAAPAHPCNRLSTDEGNGHCPQCEADEAKAP